AARGGGRRRSHRGPPRLHASLAREDVARRGGGAGRALAGDARASHGAAGDELRVPVRDPRRLQRGDDRGAARGRLPHGLHLAARRRTGGQRPARAAAPEGRRRRAVLDVPPPARRWARRMALDRPHPVAGAGVGSLTLATVVWAGGSDALWRAIDERGWLATRERVVVHVGGGERARAAAGTLIGCLRRQAPGSHVRVIDASGSA